MDNIKKAIEEAKCTVALDENDEMVTLDEPRYYFTKDGLFNLLEMVSENAFFTGMAEEFAKQSGFCNEDKLSDEYFDDYWQQTLKALKE